MIMGIVIGTRIGAVVTLAITLFYPAYTLAVEHLPTWGDPLQITQGIEVNSVQFLSNGKLLFAAAEEIFMVNADGTDLATLFPYEDLQRANMSPDKRKIVVDNGLDIFIANPDGSALKPIADDPNIFEFAISFTPDGKKITFVTIDDVNKAYGIWIMDPDGSNKRKLLSSGELIFRHPRQSPDGTRISYFAVGKGKLPRIWVMEKGGKNNNPLTKSDMGEASRQASWSSDGKQFVYSSRKFGDFDLWMMDTDGSNKKQITSIRGDEAKPVWSPDGQSLAFVCSDCRGAVGSDLYIISRK